MSHSLSREAARAARTALLLAAVPAALAMSATASAATTSLAERLPGDGSAIEALTALSTESLASSITDRRSSDGSAIEVTSEPAGTNEIHIAVMSDLAGDDLRYLNIPASQTTYTPPAGTPVVDVQAMSSGTPLGNWAGRMQTEPAKEVPAEEPGTETPAEEEPAAEPPSEEEPSTESTPGETSPRMHVGIDAGGWDWESAVRDLSGAVHYLRASYAYYNSDSQMALLARYHVHLMPLFNGNPSTLNRDEYAKTVLDWFKRYGKGGTFWAGREDLGATTAEIVNEPGGSWFWGAGAPNDQNAYGALVEQVDSALSVLPHPPTLLVSYDGGGEGGNYGRTLVREHPRLLQLGIGWTVHPYGLHGADSALGNRTRVMEAHEDTHQPVYVTEVGWPTATGQPWTGDSMQWSELQQAANITRFIRWADSLGYVRAVVDFNYADYGSNDWYGIVNPTGTVHKLSYAALAAASRIW